MYLYVLSELHFDSGVLISSTCATNSCFLVCLFVCLFVVVVVVVVLGGC